MTGIAKRSDLEAQIARYLKRPDLADFIPELVRKGERQITRRLRLPVQEAMIAHDLTDQDDRVRMPEKYLETKVLMNSMGKPVTIELNSIFFAHSRIAVDPYPTRASRVGQHMYFWPSSSDTVTWVYYRVLDSVLTEPEVENLLLDVCGDAWLHASLMEGGILTRNEKFEAKHRALMVEHIDLLSETAHRDQFAGTHIQAESEYAVD